MKFVLIGVYLTVVLVGCGRPLAVPAQPTPAHAYPSGYPMYFTLECEGQLKTIILYSPTTPRVCPN